MIKLERAQKPEQLDDATVDELTQRFQNDGTSVWNVEFIKKPLLGSSHGKCAYCETRLDEESKYMEVEHFKDKKDFPDDVVSWENLLPACKKCNGNKSSYNIIDEGLIINPYDVAPSDHIYIKDYRIRWRDDTGRRTVEVVYLNDSDRLVRVRFEVGEMVASSLEDIRNLLEGYVAGDNSVRRRNRIINGVRNLLLEAQPTAQFSAVSATVLLGDANYQWIKSKLIELGMWEGLDGLEDTAALLILRE